LAYNRRTAGRFAGSGISRKLTFSAFVSALAIAAFATESQAVNWTGCHGAVAAGPTKLTADPESGADGKQIGVAAGCDYQVDDRVAFGAFLGYDWKSFDIGFAGEDATALTFGGRAGFLLGRDRDTFAYGLFAYTNGQVDDGDEYDGLAYGGGLESVVYRNGGGFLTLKGEARWIDYNNLTKVDGVDEVAETTVTAGFAYHFTGAATADDTLPLR
jgi:hypothetical protein